MNTRVDVTLVGGGIAGAWLLNLLNTRGYRTVLIEAEGFGTHQTLASQGMIHGGLKYALSGNLTAASEAIADMPARWRACLAGEDDVDLRNTRLAADRYYMFAKGTALGRLTGFFASKALRGRIDPVSKADWPDAFRGFDGVLYQLNDFVVETQTLLSNLTDAHRHRTIEHRLTAQEITAQDEGFHITTPYAEFDTQWLVSCAGEGAAALIEGLDIDLKTQVRPLKQVVVRPKHETALFAHCLTGIKGNEPRLTITTHRDAQGSLIYLGGAIATTGVNRSDAEQIEFAKAELATCLPWLDWTGADFETFSINRAEPYQKSGQRPDEAYVEARGRFIQCFPTKLALAPDLGDKVAALLPPPSASGQDLAPSQRPVGLGNPPW